MKVRDFVVIVCGIFAVFVAAAIWIPELLSQKDNVSFLLGAGMLLLMITVPLYVVINAVVKLVNERKLKKGEEK